MRLNSSREKQAEPATAVCGQCNWEAGDTLNWASFCPRCGGELSVEQAAKKGIARFHSLADAGFFSEILAASGFHPSIRQRDESSLSDGGHTQVYLLFVPDGETEAAAKLLHKAVEATGGHEEDDVTTGQEVSLISWRNTVMVLVTGGLACAVLSNFLPPGQAAPKIRRPALWQAMGELDGTWQAAEPDAANSHRVLIEHAGDVTVIEDDYDGDGVVDRRRRFVRGELDRDLVRQ
jgi:hypothetical protein